jgi:multiple sugar transport system permease protein
MVDLIYAWALLIPAFAVLSLVVFWPIINGIQTSFTENTLKTRRAPYWNDFQNYKDLYESGDIQFYFENTLVFVSAIVVLQFVVALGIALLLNSDIKWRNLFRGLFLMPWTIPSVVVALLWLWMLQPQYGVVNYLLHQIGLVARNQQWVQNPDLAMPSVAMASVWRQFPIMVVMLLAGLQTIPKNLVEAAKIDGASDLNVFRHVTIPFLRPVIGTTVLITIINNFQSFTIIFNMTGGGPVKKTTTLSIATYQEAFRRFDIGTGSAIGVLWLLALIGITVIYNLFLAQREIGT